MSWIVHCQALLLSAASSTDNLLVGLSLGLRKRCLSPILLLGIATANATGCLVALLLGHRLGDVLPESTAYLLAGLAFGYLAWQEYTDDHTDDDRDDLVAPSPSEWTSMWQLALPMTLNNLAGGVAGGALGLRAMETTTYAWIVSVVAMYGGHAVGRRRAAQRKRSMALWTTALYLSLSLQSFWEASRVSSNVAGY